MGLIGDVVIEWTRHAAGLKTIVFGPTIVHCEELVRQFRAAGVSAATFTADTSDAERKALLEEYRKPDSTLRVLVSVEALAKGFDVPDVGCVIDCRPLRKSLSTFIQMIGRGLRISPETGKTECVLIDCSGNVVRFADDFADVYFNGLASLDMGEKLDKEVRADEDHEPKSCLKCGFTPCGKRCVRCGFEPIRKSLIEHEHGEAKEIDVLGRGFTSYAPSKLDLFNALATYAKSRGHKSSSVGPKFKEITGAWPPWAWLPDAAPHTQPSPALLGKLRSLEIAFHKRKK
jgi:superfamily II DNA or RNA helicase